MGSPRRHLSHCLHFLPSSISPVPKPSIDSEREETSGLGSVPPPWCQGARGRDGRRSCNLEINQRFPGTPPHPPSLPPHPPSISHTLPATPLPCCRPADSCCLSQKPQRTMTVGLQRGSAETVKMLKFTGPGWDDIGHASKSHNRGLPPDSPFFPPSLSSHHELSLTKHSLCARHRHRLSHLTIEIHLLTSEGEAQRGRVTWPGPHNG